MDGQLIRHLVQMRVILTILTNITILARVNKFASVSVSVIVIKKENLGILGRVGTIGTRSTCTI